MAARKMSKRSKRSKRRFSRKMRGGASAKVNVYFSVDNLFRLTNFSAFTDDANVAVKTNGPTLKIDISKYTSGNLSSITGMCILSTQTTSSSSVLSFTQPVLFYSSTHTAQNDCLLVRNLGNNPNSSGDLTKADKLNTATSTTSKTNFINVTGFNSGNGSKAFGGIPAQSKLPTISGLPSTASAPSPATANVKLTLTFV